MLVYGMNREAGDSVQIIETTYYGRVRITAQYNGNRTWRVAVEYPAIGVDQISIELDPKVIEDIRTVKLLKQWIHRNDELFASAVRQARKTRYDYRSQLFKGDSDNG
jgi:hypothetical protein